MKDILYKQTLMFIIMTLIGIFFNPMNILAYRLNDLYFSYTLAYGGLLMASNMIWAHEIIHYLVHKQINIIILIIGLIMSISISIFLLRKQFLINDEQWLKRMISHHSTALTTSHNIYNKTKNKNIKNLAKQIINNQKQEIEIMKKLL